MAEYANGPQLLFAGAEGPVEGEQALLASVRRAAVVPARVPREGLSGGFGVELGALGHAERDHEGALDFDLDVRQGVKELFVGAVVEAEGSAVRPSHCQIRLHRRVEKQRVAYRHGETARSPDSSARMGPTLWKERVQFINQCRLIS